MEPSIIRAGLLTIQCCVPKEYTDQQIVDYVEKRNPCGTTGGWHVRKEGNRFGSPERVECAKDNANVHVLLDA